MVVVASRTCVVELRLGSADELRDGLRAVVEGRWGDLDATLSADELNIIAHMVNGYTIAEEHLGTELAPLFNRLQDAYRETGRWEGTTVELLAGFFAVVRRWRSLYTFPTDGDEHHREALALFEALQTSLRKHPDAVRLVAPPNPAPATNTTT